MSIFPSVFKIVKIFNCLSLEIKELLTYFAVENRATVFINKVKVNKGVVSFKTRVIQSNMF